MNHTISDFVIRLKNASRANRKEVVAPYARVSKEIAQLLVKEGYLKDVQETETDGHKAIQVSLRYDRRNPVLTDVRVFSKPSLRIYIKAKGVLRQTGKGLGITVVSTSQGIMTARDADKKGIGGEVLFRVS